MRKHLMGAGVIVTLVVPSVAVAKPVTPQHRHAYLHVYHVVRKQFGPHETGCNLLERKGSCHIRATDAAVLRSLGTLERDIAPPPAAPVHYTSYRPQAPLYSSPYHSTYHSVVTTAPAPTSSTGGSSGGSGLVGCIISSESGGSATVVNSSGHMGLGQWDQSTWIADGGGRYASTPLGASATQQTQIIQQQVAAGNTGQWTNYDHC